jgi:hypothetical protein
MISKNRIDTSYGSIVVDVSVEITEIHAKQLKDTNKLNMDATIKINACRQPYLLMYAYSKHCIRERVDISYDSLAILVSVIQTTGHYTCKGNI